MLARLLAVAVLAACLAPTAAAHISFCTEGVCVYEWEWNWGQGSCLDGDDHWWSYRVARVSVDTDDSRQEVEAQAYCDSHDNDGVAHESSSLHVEWTTTDHETGETSWVWVDWYGAQRNDEYQYCVIRVWSVGQDLLPTGVVERDCPLRPPFLLET